MNDYLQKAKFLQNKIKEILLSQWDPIGIKEFPEAKDEYDSYVPHIYKLLISQKKEIEIFDYLWRVETEYMGLTGDRRFTRLIAKQLIELYNRVK